MTAPTGTFDPVNDINKTQETWIGPSNTSDAYFANSTNNSKTFGLTNTTNVFTIQGGTKGVIEFELVFSGDKPSQLKVTNKGKHEDEYYLVGDMNDWFSNEFEHPVEKDGKLSNKGMNHAKMQAEKASWKFKKSTAKPDGQDGWYEIQLPLLYGQFQIFDGSSKMWNGEVYAHKQKLNDENYSQYIAYYSHPITRDNIKNQNILTSNDDNGLVLKNQDEDKKNQANLHMECNAVREATIYFKPGSSPKLKITGTPVDYYIFYAMEPISGQTDNNLVTSWIQSGKPNVNNYYLPGIKYDSWNRPLCNVPDGDRHMNLPDPYNVNDETNKAKGIDLVKFTKSDDSSWKYNNFSSLIKAYDGQLVDQLDKHKLPNGLDIDQYNEIWVQKIPSGFEYPAGRKYTMQFINARNEDDKRGKHNVTTDHMYFFPIKGGLHVHFNTEQMEQTIGGNKIKVSYRVYTQDADYNTVVVEHDGANTSERIIYHSNENVGLTDISEKDNKEWVDLEHFHGDSNWFSNDADRWVIPVEIQSVRNWNVKCSDAECGWEHVGTETKAPAKEATDDTATDKRFAERSQYGQAFVQFKLEFDYNGADANDGQGTHKVYYMPLAPTVRETPHHTKFNGQDVYVAPQYNLKDIVTGISKIPTDEEYDESVSNAEPVYYNLQGVRVQNPGKGLYIKVTGNRSEKVIL